MNKSKIMMLMTGAVMLLGMPHESAFAQDAPALVIEGGMLIDGLGGEPLNDAIVVIENGRFSAIGERGDIAIPAGAEGSDPRGGPTELTVLGEDIWPHHKVFIDEQLLETRYISTEELRATLPAELVADLGMYKITVRSKGEPNPASMPAPLVVGYR